MTSKSEIPSGLRRILMRTGWAAGAVVLFSMGFLLRGVFAPSAHEGHTPEAPVATGDKEVRFWTCAMHPEIHAEKPGLCPKCGMELIPVYADEGTGSAEGPREYRMSKAAAALLDVQTSPAERRFVDAEVRMVGKIAYDETRLASISAWVPGRIDRLYVDYTGIRVNEGDHLVYLYSPELLIAQQELRIASQALEKIGANAPEPLRKMAQATVEGARSKLSRWGLTDAQVRKAEQSGETSDHITIYAPLGGTVIERLGQEGAYVDTGSVIYVIADLDAVWVMLEAYESDLPWLHFGQTATFTTEAYPGEVFEGKIAFISPLLDGRTRTVNVRLNVPNKHGKLKPEMFVRATVTAQVATKGRVMDASLAGKWISPMHPEIVKDKPGSCDICGMPLVKAESLGYVPPAGDPESKPLVIPASAPLVTGKRAVVYVQRDTETPSFEGREIVLGARAGDYYIVASGLEEGERVVTNGNFQIDSAVQILAKPSMMTPDTRAVQQNPVLQPSLAAILDPYLEMQGVLANDDAAAARESAAGLLTALDGVDTSAFGNEATATWRSITDPIREELGSGTSASIDDLRARFGEVSKILEEGARTIGLPDGMQLALVHCPMALDNQGANWLQQGTEIRNPFFGAAMLHCGEVQETIGESSAPEDHTGHDHGTTGGMKGESHE